MEDNDTVDLRIKFQRSGLFSWVTLKVRICRLSVSQQNMKVKRKAIILYNVDAATQFWKREKICQVFGLIYFELQNLTPYDLMKHFSYVEYTEILITKQLSQQAYQL